MPIRKGRTDAVVAGNIAELMRSGYRQKQAVAIAMKSAGRQRKKPEIVRRGK